MSVVAIAALLAVLFLSLNALVAFAATHPLVQDAILGSHPARRSPGALGLPYREVLYASRRDAWWIPAAGNGHCIVIVHGYNTFPDPKSGEPAPALEFAAAAHRWGYGTLVINLGYGTGAHPFSGGYLEAEDVILAARWCAAKTGHPAALWGFSAGGSAALLAASLRPKSVAAVGVDSAFADAAQVVVDQAGRFFGLPTIAFRLVSPFMRIFAPPGPANLSVILPKQPIQVPVLLIQGSADRGVSPQNLAALQTLTRGNAWRVPGAGHVEGLRVDAAGYLGRAHAFLAESLQRSPNS